MATYRLMASMGVRELRWNEPDFERLFAKLSPAASEVYDRHVAALAAEAAFNRGWEMLMRNHNGLTSEVLIDQARLQCEVARKRDETALEYERMVLPEIIALIETKQRTFVGAKAAEDKASTRSDP